MMLNVSVGRRLADQAAQQRLRGVEREAVHRARRRRARRRTSRGTIALDGTRAGGSTIARKKFSSLPSWNSTPGGDLGRRRAGTRGRSRGRRARRPRRARRARCGCRRRSTLKRCVGERSSCTGTGPLTSTRDARRWTSARRPARSVGCAIQDSRPVALAARQRRCSAARRPSDRRSGRRLRRARSFRCNAGPPRSRRRASRWRSTSGTRSAGAARAARRSCPRCFAPSYSTRAACFSRICACTTRSPTRSVIAETAARVEAGNT